MKRGSRDTKRPSGAARMPLNVLHGLVKIVEYCWTDEYRDYQTRDTNQRGDHVFRHLVMVRKWLAEQGFDINR